jgi:hypothetical protein
MEMLRQAWDDEKKRGRRACWGCKTGVSQVRTSKRLTVGDVVTSRTFGGKILGMRWVSRIRDGSLSLSHPVRRRLGGWRRWKCTDARLRAYPNRPAWALIIIETSSSTSPSGMLITKTAVGNEEDDQCDSTLKCMKPTVASLCTPGRCTSVSSTEIVLMRAVGPACHPPIARPLHASIEAQRRLPTRMTWMRRVSGASSPAVAASAKRGHPTVVSGVVMRVNRRRGNPVARDC